MSTSLIPETVLVVFTTHTLCSLSTSALLICIIFFSTSAEVKAHISERLRVPNAAEYISMAEARKMLNEKELKELKWTVEDYIKYGKENALNKQWIKELENSSAGFHISRLESLKLQTQQSLEVLYGNQLDIVDKTMQSIYSESLYRTAFEVQKGFGVGFVVDKLDENRLSKVIAKPWAMDGVNFSNRIWKNKEKLINELHKTLVRNIISGSDPAKAIKEIENKMNVSRSAAGRLIMMESAYFSSVAQKDMFNELDVEKYQIVATLDNRTSEICSELDGKVFDMKDYEAGVTATPFHPNCRTTTIPYFDDWEELGVKPERVARDEEGNNYYVPADMTYKEWEDKIVNNTSTLKAKDGDIVGEDRNTIKIGDIDPRKTDTAIEYYNEQIRNREVENVVIVDKNGGIWHSVGNEDSVDLPSIDLTGATVTHNHPASNGIVSFSGADFGFLKKNQGLRKLVAVNSEYTYSVEIVKDLNNISYSNYYRKAMIEAEYSENFDIQHKVFEILDREGIVKYVREPINK